GSVWPAVPPPGFVPPAVSSAATCVVAVQVPSVAETSYVPPWPGPASITCTNCPPPPVVSLLFVVCGPVPPLMALLPLQFVVLAIVDDAAKPVPVIVIDWPASTAVVSSHVAAAAVAGIARAAARTSNVVRAASSARIGTPSTCPADRAAGRVVPQ